MIQYTKCPNCQSEMIENTSKTGKDCSGSKCYYSYSYPTPKAKGKGSKHVQQVNETIKGLIMEARLTDDPAPWQQPWIIIPKRNYDSSKTYSGINRWLLSYDAEISYITKDSIDKKGLKLKEKAESRFVIAWVIPKLSKKDKAGLSDDQQKDKLKKKFPFMLTHIVYLSKDVEGLEPKTYTEDKDNKKFDNIDEFIKSTGIKLEEGGNRATYNRVTDTIVSPRIEQYTDSEEYYRTILHELTHATAHKDRLNRDAERFGAVDEYGKEELIAEMAGAYMCHYFGIEINENSVSYLDNWLTQIDADPYLLVSSGQRAEKVLEHFKLTD